MQRGLVRTKNVPFHTLSSVFGPLVYKQQKDAARKQFHKHRLINSSAGFAGFDEEALDTNRKAKTCQMNFES